MTDAGMYVVVTGIESACLLTWSSSAWTAGGRPRGKRTRGIPGGLLS